uniref:Uncharacterized protein n=1 Tax=Glossina pallidipes TaxID=7398 RepID=A0A1A9ZWF3_GLOPL
MAKRACVCLDPEIVKRHLNDFGCLRNFRYSLTCNICRHNSMPLLSVFISRCCEKLVNSDINNRKGSQHTYSLTFQYFHVIRLQSRKLCPHPSSPPPLHQSPPPVPNDGHCNYRDKRTNNHCVKGLMLS